MNCPECDDLLQQHLDGAGPDRAALGRHLAACPDCRDRHAAAQRLRDGLRLFAPPVPPADLAGRIVAGVLAQRRAALRFRRGLLAVAGLAAGLLLAVFFGPYGPQFGNPESRPQGPEVRNDQGGRPTKAGAGNPRSPAPPAASDPLLQGVAEARKAAVRLTKQTVDTTVDRARQLLPAVPMAPMNP